MYSFLLLFILFFKKKNVFGCFVLFSEGIGSKRFRWVLSEEIPRLANEMNRIESLRCYLGGWIWNLCECMCVSRFVILFLFFVLFFGGFNLCHWLIVDYKSDLMFFSSACWCAFLDDIFGSSELSTWFWSLDHIVYVCIFQSFFFFFLRGYI